MAITPELRKEIAATLRQGADQSISEADFWRRLENWRKTVTDPRIMIAWEQADHFWGNFHATNIFLMKAKPDKHQVEQGQEHLRLLARGFEEDWNEQRMEEELHQI